MLEITRTLKFNFLYQPTLIGKITFFFGPLSKQKCKLSSPVFGSLICHKPRLILPGLASFSPMFKSAINAL